VPSDRAAQIIGEMSAEMSGRWSSPRLCEVTSEIVRMSGAGVMLMSGDFPRGSLCATNDVSNLIEELQFTLGEGPCVDAYQEGAVVLEPDLVHPLAARWLAFTPPVVEAGVGAIFAFPLQVGTARLGALDLYRTEAGPLSDEQHGDAMVLADIIASWVLDVQADAPKGVVAADLERDADFHYVVHNAAGAVSVRLGVSITDALIRLRAYAFSHDRPLHEVAEDVVSRKLTM
jgi:hypothetical protein